MARKMASSAALLNIILGRGVSTANSKGPKSTRLKFELIKAADETAQSTTMSHILRRRARNARNTIQSCASLMAMVAEKRRSGGGNAILAGELEDGQITLVMV